MGSREPFLGPLDAPPKGIETPLLSWVPKTFNSLTQEGRVLSLSVPFVRGDFFPMEEDRKRPLPRLPRDDRFGNSPYNTL